MKITCYLLSRETGKNITSTVIEKPHIFCIFADNPFPASTVFSGAFSQYGGHITYQVDPAPEGDGGMVP